ncbi:hypothetical protein LEP1GSC103_0064 [Leptospira borgpetersenii serovar Javanica str. UI 09931]|uniref:Uncharacterized protein n=5 Tax=Leptospira borgpetersenii TaxID=174 RepID=M3GHC4_LEPBO|nr:hypothetical protein LBBP_03561 [Leptospira borgpetersenii serovar Ballum]EKP14706.1 hypothetical protein LEP1GSC128_1892 [Leptospira borgpetersenii str. 200801926]EKQ92502.1 hypothetical protein LEP1GSC101_2462 [Leptospira borgpetersenii str. UI 09149]EKQ99846.1 hypothetical protein LEP1GSC121_1754 [Leptospira borgpetersenii serovar Castellonis str. 200801910]EMG00372.1 hypothetical protein LEP1GSC123_2271 [Leptospira borgpetersenii str. 200701203]EMK08501.1 hypothetical protein LEP1GSC066
MIVWTFLDIIEKSVPQKKLLSEYVFAHASNPKIIKQSA